MNNPLSLLRPAACLLACAALATPLLAQPGRPETRIDPATGRDLEVYPPDRLFNHHHMKLVIDLPDPATPHLKCRQEIKLAAIGTQRSSVRLRAGDRLSIQSVKINGQATTFTHDKGTLEIQLPTAGSPGKPGVPFTITTTYEADKPGGRGAGLTWSKDDNDTPEVDFMFHSQGQPESNHLWFPCHDFPNERLSTEIIATVPSEYQVVSNGRLCGVSRHPAGASDPVARTTYHWSQAATHPYYLVAMIIGRFDVVDVGGPDTARPGLWMPVYGPVGSADVIRDSFSTTPDMVALFERLFDEPYPWDKYANVICRDFAAGAMENTSCTTWADFGATMGKQFVEPTNAHELCHQWFGDLVGYKSWEHLWLGEGWATYGECLWAEHVQGARGYQRTVFQNLARERMTSRGTAPAFEGMVTNRYNDPDERFMSADNVYSKGGVFLHTLRARLGDDAFWAGVRLYLDRHKFAQAETDDFRKCLEEASGQSLERHFDQFAMRPGMPRFAVDLSWDDSEGSLVVVCDQTQPVDADNPAYAVTLPIYITIEGHEPRYVYLNTDTTHAEGRFKLPAKPATVSVDPNLTVLADTKVRQPLAMLLRQLEHAPTFFAQAQAAESLAQMPDEAAHAALDRLALDQNTDPLLRSIAQRLVASRGD
ncbi:MAG: M1 family metallopeptidase [Phycisphaerales bacterium]|nr:M1 family metallopeptidase [Phycisphaerales bacterium]